MPKEQGFVGNFSRKEVHVVTSSDIPSTLLAPSYYPGFLMDPPLQLSLQSGIPPPHQYQQAASAKTGAPSQGSTHHTTPHPAAGLGWDSTPLASIPLNLAAISAKTSMCPLAPTLPRWLPMPHTQWVASVRTRSSSPKLAPVLGVMANCTTSSSHSRTL